MKILLTSTSFMDTPGAHHDLLESIGAEIDTLRGPVSEEVLLPIIGNYDAIVCGDDEYTRKVLETGKAGKLRYLSKYGIGLDKIDLAAAKDLGIPVASTPGVNHVTVAEHTFTHILAFFKNYYEEVGYVKEGKWKRLIQHEIYGKKLSIFGLGRIGKELSIRAKAFGLDVKVYDPFADKDFVTKHELTLCDNLDDLFNEAEIISLHSPLNEQTKNILNADRFVKLTQCPLLVNTARAGLVDKEAVMSALDKKLICGYVADVMWDEPVKADDPILKYPNVFITPHISSRTYESVVRQGSAAVINLINLIKQ